MRCFVNIGGGGVEIQETETYSQISDWFLWCYRIFGFKPSPPVMVRQLFGSNTQLHIIINELPHEAKTSSINQYE